MNKKGQQDWQFALIGIFMLVIFFLIMILLFRSITVTKVQFKISDGSLSDGYTTIKENSISRITYWLQGIGRSGGYYYVNISTHDFDKTVEGVGNSIEVVYINQFFNCVDITVSNSLTKEILDSRKICKRNL